MKERGILFSAPMVRAVSAGEKTLTRRVVTGKVALEWLKPGMFTREYVAAAQNHLCPYGVPGDRLWVRETFYCDHWEYPHASRTEMISMLEYRADHDCRDWEAECPCGSRSHGDRSLWRPSIHMPRWASRITLELKAVCVERLQDISEDDAVDEGCTLTNECGTPYYLGAPHPIKGARQVFPFARQAFQSLWDSINGKRVGCSWDDNPWVWVLEFEQLPRSSDEAT